MPNYEEEVVVEKRNLPEESRPAKRKRPRTRSSKAEPPMQPKGVLRSRRKSPRSYWQPTPTVIVHVHVHE